MVFDASGGDAALGQGGSGGAGGASGGNAGSAGDGGIGGRFAGNYVISNPQGGYAGDAGEAGISASLSLSGSDGSDNSGLVAGAFTGLGGGGGSGVSGGVGGDGGSGGATDGAGAGGVGGDGADGGDGGDGGVGGTGGAAGGGAGGTIKLFASKLSIATDGAGNATVTVDTAGGQGTLATSDGGDGRILLGSNDSDASDERVISTTTLDTANYYAGPTAANPFIYSTSAQSTPYIPDLLGGAQVYGLLDLAAGLDYKTLLDFDLNTVAQDDAPADALVALYRVDSGYEALLGGEALDFSGYDLLLMINLTQMNLAIPSLGIHLADSADATLTTRLGYDGLADSELVQLDALNAGAIWVTLVPETVLTVSASINGQVSNLSAAELGVDEVAYITATRGLLVEEGAGSRGEEVVYTLDEQGNRVANSVQVGTLVDFDGLSEIVESRGGGRDLYALAEGRDALLVIDAETLELRQLIENGFDGVSLFEDARNLFTSADGQHVYVQVNDEQIAIFERNDNTRLLSFSTVQSIDYEIPGNLFFDADNYSLQHFVLSEWFDTAIAHITYDSDPGDGDDTQTEEVIKSFVRDPSTGLFTALTLSDPEITTERVEYNPDRAGPVAVHDIALMGDDLYLLQEDLTTGESYINQLFVGYPSPGAGLLFGTGGDADGASYGFNGATDLVVVGESRLYALDPEQGKVTVMDWAALGGLTLLSSVTDGLRGASGLAGVSAIAEPDGASYFFAIGQDAGAVPVVDLASGAQVQKLLNNAGGVSGFVNPQAALASADGTTLWVSTISDGVTAGGLMRFSRVGNVGNVLLDGLNTEEAEGEAQLNVLADPFGETEGLIDSWRFIPSGYYDFPSTITPVLLEKSGDEWVIVGVGATKTVIEQEFGVAQEESFDLVSGSALTAGRYFGWLTRPNSMIAGGVSYTDDTSVQVIRLDTSENNLIVAANTASYSEGGYLFTTDATGFDTRVDNGILPNTVPGSMVIAREDGGSFSLTELGLTSYFSANTITLTGTLAGGGTVQETITYPSQFSRNAFSLSNLQDVVSVSIEVLDRTTFNDFTLLDSASNSVTVAFAALINGGADLATAMRFSAGETLTRAYSMQASTTIVERANALSVEYSGFEALSVGTGEGSDVVTVSSAPAIPLTLTTGDGGDTLLVSDLGSAGMTVELGSGSDEVLVSSAASGTLTVAGGAGDDRFELAAFGANSTITLSGEADDDRFSVNGAAIATRLDPATPEILIHGGDPDAASGGNDTLLFIPSDPSDTILPNDAAPSGELGIDPALGAYGALAFDGIEGTTVLAAPQITFVDPGVLYEGEALALSVDIVPNGSGAYLSENLVWTVNGSRFTVIGNTDASQTLSLSWEFLSLLYGVDDDGRYQISAQAVNGDGFSATETFELVLTDVAPVVNLNGDTGARAGAALTIGFSTTDVAADIPVSWGLDWGDGSSESLGAGSATARHSYAEPGDYTITVSVLDDDGVSASSQQLVTITAPLLSAGGAYSIAEGEALDLLASVSGTPTSVAWDLDNDGLFDDASGASVSVSWATLVALGIDDDLSAAPIAVQASYASGSPVSASTTLSVLNVAPEADGLSHTAGSGVAEGSSGATVQVGFVDPTDAGDGDIADLVYSFDFDSDGTFDLVGGDATVYVPAAYLADDGEVRVTARIADDDGGFTDYLTTFDVLDVLPSFTLVGASSVAEGSPYSLSVTNLVDPGASDVISGFSVDWGDGEEAESYTQVQMLAGVSHTFADDTGAGTATISVTAVSNDGSVTLTLADLSVSNAAPEVTALSLDTGAIVEGGLVTLRGSVVDAGLLDTQSLSIDWGDGAVEVFTLDAGGGSFSPSHRYLDDGSYQISLVVSDSDGSSAVLGSGVADLLLDVSVSNAAPSLALALQSSEIGEGEDAILSGTLLDAGVHDLHTVTVDWGDGTQELVTLDGRSFQASHLYADDDGTASVSDTYLISVAAVDNADASSVANASVTLTVVNIAPTVVSVTSDAFDTGALVSAGQTINLEALFKEYGFSDTHTATIDWGDGTTTTSADSVTLSFDSVAGSGAISAAHTYAAAGLYTVTLTLSDDDLGTVVVVLENTVPGLTLDTLVSSVTAYDNLDSRVLLATVNVSDGDTFSNNVLSLSGADAALFELYTDPGADADSSDDDVVYLALQQGVDLTGRVLTELSVNVDLDDADLGPAIDAQVPFTLSVVELVNNAPMVNVSALLNAVAEDDNLATAIDVATITLSDDGYGDHSLSLSGADAALFELVDAGDGWTLAVRAGVELAAESQPQLNVTIDVDDTTLGAPGSIEASKSFTLFVTDDINLSPSLLTSDVRSEVIYLGDADAAPIVVATLSVVDDFDGSEVWGLTGEDAALFELVESGDTAQLRLVQGAVFDADANPTLDVSVTLDDPSLGSGVEDSAAFSFAVSNAVNNFAPVLDNLDVALDENSTDGTLVTTLVASDADALNGGLSYTITAGNEAGIFTLDSATGELRVADGSLLDREALAQVVLTVEVSDNGPLTPRSDTAIVTVTLNDLNESAPSLDSASAEVLENAAGGTLVATFTASDGDATHGTFSYSIRAGNDAGWFELDSSSGELRVAAGVEVDYEQFNNIGLTIEVSDGGPGAALTSSTLFTIGITDTPDYDEFVDAWSAYQTKLESVTSSRRRGSSSGGVVMANPPEEVLNRLMNSWSEASAGTFGTLEVQTQISALNGYIATLSSSYQSSLSQKLAGVMLTGLGGGASTAALDDLYAEYGEWCTLLGLDAMAESTFDYLASRL